MTIKRAPDSNLHWKNWDDTVEDIKRMIENIKVLPEPARKNMLRDAKNKLNGVPDAHPAKAWLKKQLDQLQ